MNRASSSKPARKRLVVVGAVAAGASAAAKARRTAEDLEIILVEAGPYMSYANCGLPYFVGGEIAERDSLFVVDAPSFARRFDIDVRLDTRVEHIAPDTQTVALVGPDGITEELSYDRLILATGTVPIVPRVDSLSGPEVFMCRTVQDVDAIDARLQALDRSLTGATASALVIGGGFIGVESAEQLNRRGLSVTLVELASQVLPPLDPEMALPARRSLEASGIEVVTDSGLVAVDRRGDQAEAVLASGRRIPFDLVLVAVGVRPNVALAHSAGLRLGASGAIEVDQHQRTSDPAIYAAGDNSESRFLPTGEAVNVALAGPANKQGRVAGANAALDLTARRGIGGRPSSGEVLGTAVVRAGGVTAGITGLSERRARSLGLDAGTTYVQATSHAGYYPGAEALVVKLVWDRQDGRLLGAQVSGGEGGDKRLDVLATAIHARFSVEDLEDLDLAYAPPFASAKDAEVMAGFVAANSWRGSAPTVSPTELLGELADTGIEVLDVRTPLEFAAGHLDGALNVPLDDLRSRLDEVPPGPLVVMCASGHRSYVAQQILGHHGWRQVRNLTGGWNMLEMYRGTTTAQSINPAEAA
jgi:NADPH-dependent 2,4-dienoyl-CoA reductase/sulfur reductase-like enzyme/rhodanese-related sulfurtransferase